MVSQHEPSRIWKKNDSCTWENWVIMLEGLVGNLPTTLEGAMLKPTKG